MTRLIVVRHGESAANRGGIFAGQTDVELQDKGIEQAKKTAEYIAANYSIDKVYASDLTRARKTGEIIANLSGTSVILNKELREINAGEWQGKSFDFLIANYADEYSRWLHDIGNCFCPGGESVAQLCARVSHVMTEIAKANPEKTVVVATHGTFIRAMQCILKGLPVSSMKDISWSSNASFSEIIYENGSWTFIKESVDDHLSTLKTTFAANV